MSRSGWSLAANRFLRTIQVRGDEVQCALHGVVWMAGGLWRWCGLDIDVVEHGKEDRLAGRNVESPLGQAPIGKELGSGDAVKPREEMEPRRLGEWPTVRLQAR